WAAEPAAQSDTFRQRFGVESGPVPSPLLRGLQTSVAEAVNDHFEQIFSGTGPHAELLRDWRDTYRALTDQSRIHTVLLRHQARNAATATAQTAFAEHLAAWREAHPDLELSEADIARAKAGWDERLLSAFDTVFGAEAATPADLSSRVPGWDWQVAHEARDLASHFTFESGVAAALRGADRSFEALSRDRGVEGATLDEILDQFATDFVDGYQRHFAPRPLSDSWADSAVANTDRSATAQAAEADDTTEPVSSGVPQEPLDEALAHRGDTQPLSTASQADPAGATGRTLPPPQGTAVTQQGTAQTPASAAVSTTTGLPAHLLGLPADALYRELPLLGEADREGLASDPGVVDTLRRQLPAWEFASAAAHLMVRVPAGVEQPVSARNEAQKTIARMLHDPDVAAKLLKGGSTVLVVPKSQKMTSFEPFLHLKGKKVSPAEKRTWDETRGVGSQSAAVTEENLLGEKTGVPGAQVYEDGYSTTVHEFAHTIHLYGLSEQQKRLIDRVYRSKLAPPKKGRPEAQWPDGPLRAVPGGPANYSSHNAFEYFAQLSTAYLGANGGLDPYTKLPRNNGWRYVVKHEKPLLPLLRKLYGPPARHAELETFNPFQRTTAENEMYETQREFWDGVENTYGPQPHGPVPPAVKQHAAGQNVAGQYAGSGNQNVAPPPPPAEEVEEELPSLVEYDDQGEATGVLEWPDILASSWYQGLHPGQQQRLRSVEDFSGLRDALEQTRNTVVAAVDGGARSEDVEFLTNALRLRGNLSAYDPAMLPMLPQLMSSAADAGQLSLVTGSVADFGQHVPYTDLIVPHPGPWATREGPNGLAQVLEHVMGPHSRAWVLTDNELPGGSQSNELAAHIEATNENNRDTPGYVPLQVEIHEPDIQWDEHRQVTDVGGVPLVIRHQGPFRLVTVVRGAGSPSTQPADVALAPPPPVRHAPAPPPALTAVFGPDIAGHQMFDGMVYALRVLEAARAGHVRFGSGQIDLPGITRLIRHLEPSAAVTAAEAFEALRTATSAHRRGRAGSLAAIAAYQLQLAGVLAVHTTLTGSVSPRQVGRHWTGASGLRFVQGHVGERRSGRWNESPAPWGDAVWVLIPQRADSGLLLLPDEHGREYEVDDEEYAEVVAHDPERPAEAQVLLLVKDADRGHGLLPRLVADRAGTRVWYSSGIPRLGTRRQDDGTVAAMPYLQDPGAEDVPTGIWLPADPGQLAADPQAVVRAADGTVFPDTDVRSYLLTTPDGQRLNGAALLNTLHTAQLEIALRSLPWVRHYTDRIDGIPGIRRASEGELQDLPWSLRDTFILALHGDRGRATVARESDGRDYYVRNEELARFIDRFLTMLNVPASKPVSVVGCEWGHQVPSRDRLEAPSVGQVAANVTRRDFYVSDAQLEPREEEGQTPPRLIRTVDPGKPAPRWSRLPPEPDTDTLAELADLAGLPTRLPQRTTRALRWVRALRELFGPGIDTDPRLQARFHALVRGFGALERRRLRIPGNAPAGPLTWAELDDIAAAWPGSGNESRTLNGDLLTALLRRALDGEQHASGHAGYIAPSGVGPGSTPDAQANPAHSLVQAPAAAAQPPLPPPPDTVQQGGAGAPQSVASVGGAAPAAFPAVQEPRFPGFFTGPLRTPYLERSARYGQAVARTLAADPLVREHLQMALRNVVRKFRSVPGGLTPTILRLLHNRSSLTGFDAVAAEMRLLDSANPPPFEELISSFHRVAPHFAWAAQVPATVGIRPLSAAWDGEMRRRGYRGSRELTPPQLQQAWDIELMLRVHRHLGRDSGDAFMFRDAVAGWFLSRPDALPWEWFLDVSHRVGLWDRQVEPDPWLTDMSRVHGWMHGDLDPRVRLQHGSLAGDPALRDALKPPHVLLYAEQTVPLLSAEVTGPGGWFDPGVVLGHGLSQVVGLTEPAASLWRERREALRDLLRNPATLEALRQLSPGHSMALTLVSGPDARLFDSGVRKEGPRALERLRELIRTAGAEADPEDRSTWPLLMLRDPAVRAVIGRSAPAAEVRAAVAAFAQNADELLLAEVRGHASMAEEALDTLPAKPADGRSALYVRTAPGPLFGGTSMYPGDGKEMQLSAFRPGSSDRAAALKDLSEQLRRGQPGTRHGVVLEVLRPLSFRETSVWSLTPGKRTVQSPQTTRLRTLGRTYGRDGRSGLWYEHIFLTEVPRPTSKIAWDNEVLVRDIRTPHGVLFGYSSYTARDMLDREAPFSRFAEVTHHKLWDSQKRTAVGPSRPWPLPSGIEPQTGKPWFVISAAHGSPHSIAVLGRFGPKLLSGTQSGAEFARRLAEAGVADGTPLLQWQCSVGSRRPGLPSVAQQAVDEHPPQRASFAGNTTVANYPVASDHVLLMPGWGAAPGLEFVKVQPRTQPRAGAPVPSTESYFAGQAARYPMGGPEWFAATNIYDAALAERLSQDQAALSLMREVVKAIADTSRYGVPVDAHRPGVSLDELTDIARAAAHTSYPGAAIAKGIDPAARAQLAMERGIQLHAVDMPSTLPLYWLYRDLDLPAERFPAFVRAVFGWGLTRRHPLFLLLFDLQRSGMSANRAALTAALAGNGPHLYGLVDTMFAPREGLPAGDLADRLRPPHWRMHTEGMAYLAAAPDGVQVPQGLMRAVRMLSASEDVPPIPVGEGSQLGADGWPNRYAAARDWNDGSLDRLDSAHVTALYLLSHDDSRMFLESGADQLPFAQGAAMLAPVVRAEIDRAVDRARHGQGLPLPLLLRHPVLHSEIERIEHAAPGSDEFNDAHQKLLDKVPLLAHFLRYQIPAHLGLAAEGLAKRPPVNRSVYLAFKLPTEGAGAALGRLNVSQFQQVRLDEAEALRELGTDQPPALRAVVEVADSTARDVTALAHDPSRSQVRYADATELAVTSREIRTDSEGNTYELLHAVELPSVDRRSALEAVKSVAEAAETQVAPLPGSNALTQSPAHEHPAQMSSAVATTSQAPAQLSSGVTSRMPDVLPQESPADRRRDTGPEPVGDVPDPWLTNAPAAPALQAPGHMALQQAGPSQVSAPHLSDPMVRFPDLYFGDRSKWLKTALLFERAIGRVMAASDRWRRTAQRTLITLRGRLAGASGGYRLFFPPGHTYSSAQREYRKLISTQNPPALSAVMEAVARGAAVHARNTGLPEPAPVDPALTARLTALGHPLVDERVAEKAERIREAELLMRVYQDLNVPDENPLAFRNAVLGWMLPQDPAPTLGELLGAAQRAGVAEKDGSHVLEPDLRTASSVEADASQLYGLVPFLLAPEAQLAKGPLAGDAGLRAAVVILPHQIAYSDWAGNLVSPHLTGGLSLKDLRSGVADTILGGSVTRQGTDAWLLRRDSFRRWMGTYRRTPPEIRSAHRVALFLLGGDDAKLMDDRITARGASGRDRLREEVLSQLMGLHQGADPARLPLVMLREPAVQRLIDHPGERSAARLQEVADALATDDMVRELAQHAEMAVRSATLMPEAEESIYWLDWEKGSVQGPHAYAVDERTFRRPRLFQAKSSLAAVLRDALVEAPRHTTDHPVVYQVKKPRQAHEYAPFARVPDGQVVYPRASTFSVKDRDIVRDLATALGYALVSVEEVPQPAERRWQQTVITREVRTPSGILFGEASFNGPDWISRSEDYPRLLHMRPGTVYEPPDFYRRQPFPLPLTTGLRQPGDKPAFTVWTSHGLAGLAEALTPEGLKRVTGTWIGRRSAQLMRQLGLGRGTRQLVFTCYGAYGPDGLPAVAQKVANEHSDGIETVGSTTSNQAHTVSDPDPQSEVYLYKEKGKPAPEWRVFQPQAGVSRDEQAARLPLAGQGPRYRSRYETPDWEQVARAHEKAIGKALDEAADAKNFAKRFADALTASGKYQVNPPGTVASVSDLMEAIDGAARRVHGDKEFTLAEDDTAREELRTVRGLLLRTGPFPSMKPLFDAYEAIEFSGGHRPFLKALIAWRLSNGTHTLTEVLGEYTEASLAEDGRGINVDRLKDALLGDAVDLYAWVRSELSPFDSGIEELTDTYDADWQPPHHQLYFPGLTSQSAGGVEVPEGLMEAIRQLENAGDLPGISEADTDYLGGGSWAARHAALRDWSARHSGSPLENLLPAHLTALYVATHGPDHRLLRAHLEPESGGATPGRDRLADAIGETIDEAMASGSLDFPYLLSEDPRFYQLATEAAGIADPAEERYGEIGAEMMGMVQVLAEAVSETVGETLGVLAEALAVQPKVDAPVYIGYLAPGELRNHLPGTLHSVVIPQFQQGSLDPGTVFGGLGDPPPGQHWVLLQAEGSPARDVSFGAKDPQARQVMFPWRTDAPITARGVMYDANGEPYEYQVAASGQRPEPMEIDSGAVSETSSEAAPSGDLMEIDSGSADVSRTGPDPLAANGPATPVWPKAAEPSAAGPGTSPTPAYPDSRFRKDVPIPHPVPVRMSRDSAEAMLAAGAITDPERHVLRSQVVVEKIRDRAGRLSGLTSFTREEAALRRDAYRDAAGLREHT
ncbi:lonely Cys domain-containing protein, partial [Streptomyces sp. NPDC007162]|uniref:lonely Cys domain-containing protein n=1 Tax=Streptomyces sp. NPDC007162 TaxID=3156917 RepID=UPI00340BEDEE